MHWLFIFSLAETKILENIKESVLVAHYKNKSECNYNYEFKGILNGIPFFVQLHDIGNTTPGTIPCDIRLLIYVIQIRVSVLIMDKVELYEV